MPGSDVVHTGELDMAAQLARALQDMLRVGHGSTVPKLQRHVSGIGEHAAERHALRREQETTVLDLVGRARHGGLDQLAQLRDKLEVHLAGETDVVEQGLNAGRVHGGLV